MGSYEHVQSGQFGHEPKDRLETLLDQLVTERMPVVQAEEDTRLRCAQIVEDAKNTLKLALADHRVRLSGMRDERLQREGDL